MLRRRSLYEEGMQSAEYKTMQILEGVGSLDSISLVPFEIAGEIPHV